MPSQFLGRLHIPFGVAYIHDSTVGTPKCVYTLLHDRYTLFTIVTRSQDEIFQIKTRMHEFHFSGMSPVPCR